MNILLSITVGVQKIGASVVNFQIYKTNEMLYENNVKRLNVLKVYYVMILLIVHVLTKHVLNENYVFLLLFLINYLHFF